MVVSFCREDSGDLDEVMIEFSEGGKDGG